MHEESRCRCLGRLARAVVAVGSILTTVETTAAAAASASSPFAWRWRTVTCAAIELTEPSCH